MNFEKRKRQGDRLIDAARKELARRGLLWLPKAFFFALGFSLLAGALMLYFESRMKRVTSENVRRATEEARERHEQHQELKYRFGVEKVEP